MPGARASAKHGRVLPALCALAAMCFLSLRLQPPTQAYTASATDKPSIAPQTSLAGLLALRDAVNDRISALLPSSSGSADTAVLSGRQAAPRAPRAEQASSATQPPPRQALKTEGLRFAHAVIANESCPHFFTRKYGESHTYIRRMLHTDGMAYTYDKRGTYVRGKARTYDGWSMGDAVALAEWVAWVASIANES